MCSTSETGNLITDDEVVIQGECVPRKTATIIIMADGIIMSLDEQFRSVMTYNLRDEVEEETFQDIYPGVADLAEWSNFDGTQRSYVFLYGSLMRRADLQAVGVTPIDVMQAQLNGWRRRWNVASDPAVKNRTYGLPSGQVFTGMVGSLGLERSADEQVHGIVVRIGYVGLAELDKREQEYTRTDVTRDLSSRPPYPSSPFRVFTFIPKSETIQQYENKKSLGQLAIAASYFHSVRDAAREIGYECLDDVDRAGGLDGVPILELTREDAG